MKLSTLAAAAFVCAGVVACAAAADVVAATWDRISWNGESAYAATSGTLRAVVSVDRGRLVYFGSADGQRNLLYASATRDAPAGWGGHRLWLGPQSEWKGGWPPPKAWETSAPESVRVTDSQLELVLGDASDGWPRLERAYFWNGGRLHCLARMSAGKRPAQFIQILQIPRTAEVFALPSISGDLPLGYAQVHMGRSPSPRKKFASPPHVSATGEKLRLVFLNRSEKLAFTPQPLVAQMGAATLTVERGSTSGKPISSPDEGLVTQVYLGSRESQLIELEQLSPLYPAGSDASFEIIVSASGVQAEDAK